MIPNNNNNKYQHQQQQQHPYYQPLYNNHIILANNSELLYEYNNNISVTHYLSDIAYNKSQSSLLLQLVQGLLSGLFITFGALLSISTAGGLNKEFRLSNPAIPKILSGLTFPLALLLIIRYNGDLFTGNCLYMYIGLLKGRINRNQLLINWAISYTTNFIGCIIFSTIFGYCTGLYSSEPYNSYLIQLTENKVLYSNFLVILIKGIAGNFLVCLAVFLGLIARSMFDSIIGILICIFPFVCIGFEHCIANMSYLILGLEYGANINLFQLIVYNLIPATIGNIIGGGIILGSLSVYLFPIANNNNKNSTMGIVIESEPIPIIVNNTNSEAETENSISI